MFYPGIFNFFFHFDKKKSPYFPPPPCSAYSCDPSLFLKIQIFTFCHQKKKKKKSPASPVRPPPVVSPVVVVPTLVTWYARVARVISGHGSTLRAQTGRVGGERLWLESETADPESAGIVSETYVSYITGGSDIFRVSEGNL